ncbi:hypothetical protein HDU80_000853, partial [Chytriomyces hyalinus]
YRVRACEKRAALSEELTRSQELERAVPEVVSALDGIRNEGIGQRVAIMDGLVTMNMTMTGMDNFVRMNANICDLRHENVSLRMDVQRSHAITYNTITSMIHANARMNQAIVNAHAGFQLEPFADSNQPPQLQFQQQPQQPQQQPQPQQYQYQQQEPPQQYSIPLYPQSVSNAVMSSSREINTSVSNASNVQIEASSEETRNTSANSSASQEGDPKLYTFFEYTRGDEILSCYNEFETGLGGRPSINTMEKVHVTKWREWRLGSKRVNKMTKTFLLRQRIYKRVKALAAVSENGTISNSAEKLQREMDALIGTNKKRGLDFFSEHLRSLEKEALQTQ